MVKDLELSSETRAEISNLINNKQDAFDMLREIYNDENAFDYSEIVSRLQAQFFAYDRNRQNILTAQEWKNDGFNNTFQVNDAIAPITSNQYSSFALVEPSDELLLHYPLDDDYIALVGPFAIKDQTEYTEQNFNKELANIQQKLGIVVKQSGKLSVSTFKQSFVKKAILKIKNSFYKLCKKQDKIKTLYSGKINLNTNVDGIQPSYVDRIAKVYDYILKSSVKDVIKNYKNGKKLPKEHLFVARIYANILMSRVLDLKDLSNNKKLEKCLWLQYANNLNKYCFSSDELKLITTIGLEAAAKTCKKLGISTSKIVTKATLLGYEYDCVPQDERIALLMARQKDYSKYSEQAAEARSQKEQFTQKQSSETKQDNSNKNANVHFSADKKTAEVKQSTVSKMVDQAVVKCLSTQGTNLAEKINQNKVKGKKLTKATSQLNLYNLALSYYIQASRSKPMAVKNNGQYNENEISKAKLIAQALIHQRQNLIDTVANNSSLKKEDQTSRAFVNEVCSEIYSDNVSKYFAKLVKGSVEYFTNEKAKNSTKEEQTEDIYSSLLESLGNQLDESLEYVPDFVMIDQPQSQEQKTQDAEEETTYKPNFIIIDENVSNSEDQQQK